MIYGILLVVSIILSVCKSTIYDRFAKKIQPNTRDIFGFNAVCYCIASIVALFCGIDNEISIFTVITAFFYAAFVFSFQALSVAAMRSGPMSLTTLFGLYGMIIPSLVGPLFWKEPFGTGQIIGIVLMLISVWILSEKKDTDNKITAKWGIMGLCCFLSSGFAGVAEKIHQTSDFKDEKLIFLFIAFCFMFIFSSIGFISNRKTPKKNKSVKLVLLLGGLSGLIVAFFCQINLTLSGNLDSLIYYPIANGGSLLMTILVSALILREPVSKKRLLGFVMGLTSIILLSIPF